MWTLLIILLILLALTGGGFGYRRFGTAGGLGPIGLLLVIFLILWLTGNLSGVRGL